MKNLCAILFFFVVPLLAQPDYKIPRFTLTPFFFRHTPDSTRIDFVISIKVSQLVFVKKQDGYSNTTEFSFYVFNKDKLVKSRTIEETFNVSTYEQTIKDSTVRLAHISFVLPCSTYRFLVKSFDKNSRKEARIDTTINVPRFDKNNIFGSILLYQADDTTFSLENIFPVSIDTIRYHTEVYHPDANKLTATVKFYGDKGVKIVQEEKIENGNIDGKICISNLPPGKYQLQISINDGAKIYKKEIPVMLSFEPENFIEMDFDTYIELLSYIANQSELDSIRVADDSQKVELLKSFWAKRDPTPKTSRNEAKEEFFQRVRYANEHFTGLRDGWRTDRGRIYIVYGPPDEIESHPFEINSPPYEIWYYYTQRLRFIFIDKNNNGEYELYNPYTPFH